MEYASNGDLLNFLKNNQTLPEKEVARILEQILKGLEHAHSKGICHRDIKLANILLDNRKNVKISDFGFSTRYEKNDKLKTFCGSPCFAAP